MKKRSYQGWCDGPFGLKMPSATAKAVEVLMAENPLARETGYRRASDGEALAEYDANERSDVSTISTARVDHDGEVVLPSGVDVTLFRKNPVVTFAHRYDTLPIGTALWIKSTGSAIKAKTRYAVRPKDWIGEWLPDAVWHLVRRGELRGKSIGFLPLEGHAPTADEIARNPAWSDARWIFTRVLLLEYAVAPVPTNPDALVEIVGKSLAGAGVSAIQRELLHKLRRLADSLEVAPSIAAALDHHRGRV